MSVRDVVANLGRCIFAHIERKSRGIIRSAIAAMNAAGNAHGMFSLVADFDCVGRMFAAYVQESRL